ncbi:protease synthase and sporulation negative regulatory protein pai 1 [Nonlabens marinus S1-08]|uniref:Protease synthase and sporulation negative regulatory protein pai 1 n=2 Tax=Nonlabens TaxID=363408 RepID=W8W0I3_9FLAO|nr:protease synthase and sporulation negative regulatory protein pai 1 [Nonlabens marinus S1-08]
MMLKPATINDKLRLLPIGIDEQERLRRMMHLIYKPIYRHLWKDDGEAYVESQYNKDQVLTELSLPNARYYFVEYKSEVVGMLRFLFDCPYEKSPNLNTTKLHRIYLDPATHGSGIGSQLIDYVFEQAIKNNQKSVWLECMDTQEPAIRFYKKKGFYIERPFTLDSPTMNKEFRGMYLMKYDLEAC